MSPGVGLRPPPHPLLTAKGHPRPALQSPPQRIEKQSNFPLHCANTHERLHLTEPSHVVAGRPFRVGKGGGRSRRRRPGDMERKGLPAAAGPFSPPVTNRSPDKEKAAQCAASSIRIKAIRIKDAGPMPPRPAPLA